MKCPYCGHDDDAVLDSRPLRDGEASGGYDAFFQKFNDTMAAAFAGHE